MLITELKSKETITSLADGKKVFIINCHGCKEVHFPETEANLLQAELAEQGNVTGIFTTDYLCNPENTELTIHARKYSVYTVAASDYVAPQPEKPESSGGTEGHPDNGAPEEEKVENSQVNKKPLEEEQKLPEVAVAFQ